MNKSTEKILIISVDFLTINLALIIYFYLRTQTGWFQLLSTPEFYPPLAAIYIFWLLIFTFVGMYRTWFAASRFDEISTLFKATFVGIFILFFIIFISDYIEGVASSNRILIFIYWALLILFVGSGRIFIRSFQRRLLINGIGRKNALIVGFNPKAFDVFNQIKRYKALGLDVKGFITTNNENIDKNYENIPVVGTIQKISELQLQYEPKEIIIALEKGNEDVVMELVAKCDTKKSGLKIVPDFYEILSGQARTSQIYGFPLIDIVPELMPEWEKKLKRILDLIISFLILLVSLPVCIAAAIAIKLEDKGPIFFTQERCGMNGELFRIVKFRSMRVDAEKLTGPVWSQKDDPRITKAGAFIRKVRIDEIPQMYNVFKGEMSIVGPRPERPYFVEKLSEEIPYYKRRLKVRPGITGWAQIKHKYDETIEDVKIKLRYDLFYIENMSIRMDFKIIFRTVFVVLFGKGHYE